jgi:hypothetical protein
MICSGKYNKKECSVKWSCQHYSFRCKDKREDQSGEGVCEKYIKVTVLFGFEFSKPEINRAIRFKQQHPETKPLFPLIERKVSGEEAHGILMGAGIELPEMYKLGYENNNCIGCVKGGKGYWNKIRIDFPETFDKMAKIEREVGATCLKEDDGNGKNRRLYLDELIPGVGITNPIVPSCGLFCQSEFEFLMDRKTDKILSGELDIKDI